MKRVFWCARSTIHPVPLRPNTAELCACRSVAGIRSAGFCILHKLMGLEIVYFLQAWNILKHSLKLALVK